MVRPRNRIRCRSRRRSHRARGGLRLPKRQHLVQHGAPHHRFALLYLEPLRTETAAEDPFVPEERALDSGLLPVAGFLPPRLSSDLGNPLVPLFPGPRSLRRRRRRPSRRDDDLNAGAAGLADRLVHAARVVGAIVREAPQRSIVGPSRSGSMCASSTMFWVSAAATTEPSSSTPMWSFRQPPRSFAVLCLREHHSPTSRQRATRHRPSSSARSASDSAGTSLRPSSSRHTVTDTVYPRRCAPVNTPVFWALIVNLPHRLTGIRFSNRSMGVPERVIV